MAEYRHHFRSRGDRFGHEGARREQPFRRYTNIPALLYLRKERKITLLNPASWNDKNGSYFLLLYREKKHLQSVLALCFTPAFETYHHLRLFAEGSSGVCISFNQEKLAQGGEQAGWRDGQVGSLSDLAGHSSYEDEDRITAVPEALGLRG